MKNDNKIILDVDTGADDALAILLADSMGLVPDIVYTSYGNVSINKTTNNTMAVLDLAQNTKTKVIKGMAKPLMVNPIKGAFTATDYHGVNGLCGIPMKIKNPNRLIGNINESDKYLVNLKTPVDWVVTGPCTNLAYILGKFLKVKDKIRRVFIMGGSLEKNGNESKYAEFNFFQDALAVKKVFESGLPVYLVTLDATCQTIINLKQLESMQSTSNIGTFAKELIFGFFQTFGIEKNRGFELYDPLTIGSLLGYVDFTKEKVNIITNGEKYGKLVRDPKGYDVYVPRKVKSKEFITLFLTNLKLKGGENEN